MQVILITIESCEQGRVAPDLRNKLPQHGAPHQHYSVTNFFPQNKIRIQHD